MNFIGHSPAAASLANTTVLACLLDHMVINKKLSRAEVAGVLARARDELVPFDTTSSAVEASRIIEKILTRFTK
jgi:hypothetical protein